MQFTMECITHMEERREIMSVENQNHLPATAAKPSPAGTRHPDYHGVRKRRWGKWVSEIREPKKKSRIWLGSFPVPEMAAKAYDVAAFCLKGPKALLNFPDEIGSLPRPASRAPRDIQAAATLAAKMAVEKCGGGAATRGEDMDHMDMDDGGDDDDFWREIELPELIHDGGKWVSPECPWWNSAEGDATSSTGDCTYCV